MRHISAGLLSLAALLAATLFGQAAQAQGFTPMDTANLFGTEHGDAFSSIFLNQIFGPIFPSVAGDAVPTVFSTIIGYFNVIILVIGGILFFYNATIGLLQSAHEGKVLGQRWSSLWAPLRIVFAVGLLVPVPGLGGYNLVQAGVAYVVKGSTNVASAVWATAAELVVNGQTPITTAPATVSTAAMRTLFDNVACEAVINHHMQVAAGAGATPFQITHLTDLGADGELTTYSMLIADGYQHRRNICGSFTTPATPVFIQRTAEMDDEVVIPGIQGDRHATIADHFNAMHYAALMDTVAELRSVAVRILPDILDNGPLPNIIDDIERVTIQANQRVSTGVADILDAAVGTNRRGDASRAALLNRIQGSCTEAATTEGSLRCYGEGWIGAGSWYMMFSRLNNELASLFGAQSSAHSGVYNATANRAARNMNIAQSQFPGDDTGIMLAMDRYMEAFDQATSNLVMLGYPMTTTHLTELADGNPSSVLSGIPGFDQWITGIRNTIIGALSPGNHFFAADPIIAMSTLGQYLINGAGVLMGAATVGGFISGGATAIMAMPLFVVMITAGSILHLLLPIMPFIFWILAVTGYFILVVEAMVAVNLWALSHMRMDGEGISGESGRQGWLMLLALLMTPVLMIFGFLIGMTIFRVTSALLDIGMFQALSGILGSSVWINLIAICSYSIFMSIFYMVLLERSFSLVSEFPGRVLKWMGAGAQLSNGEEGKARMAAAGAGLSVAKAAAVPSGALVRGAGMAGVSRGGGSGNPGNDPSRWGAARRYLTNRSSRVNKGKDGGDDSAPPRSSS